MLNAGAGLKKPTRKRWGREGPSLTVGYVRDPWYLKGGWITAYAGGLVLLQSPMRSGASHFRAGVGPPATPEQEDLPPRSLNIESGPRGHQGGGLALFNPKGGVVEPQKKHQAQQTPVQPPKEGADPADLVGQTTGRTPRGGPSSPAQVTFPRGWGPAHIHACPP